MVARPRAWLDLLAGVSLVLSATGCTIENPGHCGNQSGDATCRARPGGLPFCSLCASSNDGCVAEPIADPTCRPPADEASGTTGEHSTSSAATTGHEDGGSSSDGGSTSDGFTSSGSGITESSDGRSSEERETDAPYCGNDVKEDDEACDMTDFGGQTCASVLRDPNYRGHLDCNGTCEIITVNCCLGAGAPCLPAVNECCNDCVLHQGSTVCN